MTISIFCPSSHLILAAPRCPECGWIRPPIGDLGAPAWGPLELGAGLGGPGRSVFATPGVAQGVAVFPLRSGELAALNLADGENRWRLPVEPGLMTRDLVADRPPIPPEGERLLLSLSDERSLEQAGPGMLAALDPFSGQRTPLWQPGAHQFSPPVLAENLVLVRSSAAELVALHRRPRPDVAWRQPLQAWWALPPVVSGETVLVSDGRAMYGEGFLLAFALADGHPLWQQPTHGLLAKAPVVTQGRLIFVDGRHSLSCLELTNGKPLWQRDYTSLYSNLQAGVEHIYLVVRGAAAAGEQGYYLLQALDPLANTVAWEVPLPARARLCKLLDGQALILGSDDGRLLAYQSSDGAPLWEYTLGSEEDPIQTELVVANGFLLAGTYGGRVVTLHVRTASEEAGDPGQDFEQGDYRAAADGFALRGDLRRSAEIYAGQLDEPHKALALLEHGGLFFEAGVLARDRDLNREALKYFELAKDFLAQAETFDRIGDDLGAAEMYEKSGKFFLAASRYERGGNLQKALELYIRENDSPSVLRLRDQIPPTLELIKFLEEHELYIDAGELAEKADLLEWAAKLYRQAGDQTRELEVLVKLGQTHPEPWSLERLAEVARSRGAFRQEAEAWEKLVRPLEAAEAYHRAARQLEQLEPASEKAIADLYELAANSYAEAGLESRESQARSQVIHYRYIPQIHVAAHTSRAFREWEFNTLKLVAKNVGRGIAYDVCIQVGGERFELDQKTCTLQVNKLGPGVEKDTEIYLRPLKDQVGETVPLLVEWRWQDRHGQWYERSLSTSVEVKRLSDTSPVGMPVVINAQTYVQGTLVGGDQIAGDVIAGDQVQAGAQKGDRVEIRRGEGARLRAEGLGQPGSAAETPPLLCPNCHLPVAMEDKFCEACGAVLKSKSVKRKT